MSKQIQNQEEEIDLGGFFNQIGRMIAKGFRALGQFFKWLYKSFIMLMIFIKNNYIKLTIGALIGVVLGLAAHHYEKKIYVFEMIIIPNYDSGSYIKNKLEYYNQLIEQKDLASLSKIFGIDQTEASEIKEFKLEKIKDLKDLVEGYDKLVRKSDTTTIKELPLKTFLRSDFSEFNYKRYIVRIYTTIPSFKKSISNNLITDLENNDYLNRKKNLTLKSISIRDSSYYALLKNIDSIIDKDKKIAMIAAHNNSDNGSSINLNNKESINKDNELLELYKRTSMELAYLNEEKILYDSLFQVIAPLEPIGKEKIPIIFTTFFKVFSLIMLISIGLILFKPFLNYLNYYGKQ